MAKKSESSAGRFGVVCNVVFENVRASFDLCPILSLEKQFLRGAADGSSFCWCNSVSVVPGCNQHIYSVQCLVRVVLVSGG